MEGLPNVENNKEIIRTLRKYLDDGMLLHGSKTYFEELKPQQAHDDDPSRIIGKSFAIYAEAHDIRIPIIMALFAQDKPSVDGWQSGYSGHGPSEPLTISGTNYTFSPGFIYVLPPNQFKIEETENEREYIATEAVQPIDVIPINPSILNEFPDIVYAS